MAASAKVSVIRISGSSIRAATFRNFAPGAVEWARMNGLDRKDYESYLLTGEPGSEEISHALLQMLRQIPKDGILVIGIPGPIEKGKIVACPALPDLITILPEALSENWSGEVILANNTDLFAEAELKQGIFRTIDPKTGIIITLGRGVGSAIVKNGQVDLDSKVSGGEIGHTLVDPNGPACECDHRGCFEQYISGPALKRIAADRGIFVEEPLHLAEIAEAQPIIDEARELLVDRLSFATTLLRTRTIVLAGRLAELYVIQMVQEMLNQHIPHFVRNDQGVKVHASRFMPSEGALLGGGIVGLRIQGIEPSCLSTIQ